MIPKISAYIITRNEEKYIRSCLESIKDIVDEIIILDGFSIDNTINICKEYTNKIYFHKFSGSFAEERTIAVSYCNFEWILQIDADETLSPELQSQIQFLIENREYSAYSFVRRNYYDKDGKKYTKHAYYPDYQPRLFQKNKIKYNLLRTIMEEAIIEGNICYLPENLYMNHYVPNKYALSNFKNQHLRSCKLQAKWEKYPKSKLYYILKIPFVFVYHFIKMYFISKWYKDNIPGFKASFIMSLYMVMVNYYSFTDNDKIPLFIFNLFKDSTQRKIDNEYKIKIWKDL